MAGFGPRSWRHDSDTESGFITGPGRVNERAGWARSRVLVVAAVGYQWFYNGGNYVAFKIGGDAVHPLLVAATRFTIAAALVLPLALWWMRSRSVRARELAAAAALGLVMLIGSQTLGIPGTHLLPAGVASVFGSAAPLFLALFAWAVLREPLGWRRLCGVGLGFAGLALMAWFTSTGGGFSPLGAALNGTGGAIGRCRRGARPRRGGDRNRRPDRRGQPAGDRLVGAGLPRRR